VTNYEVSHPGPLLMSSTIPNMKTLTSIGTVSGKLELTFRERPVGWLKT